jgi:hypothetical protein
VFHIRKIRYSKAVAMEEITLKKDLPKPPAKPPTEERVPSLPDY